MEKDSKIFVAGHRGLVGSAILNNLRSKGYTNFLLRTHAELDLTDQAAVNEFFAAERPDYVFLSAAQDVYKRQQWYRVWRYAVDFRGVFFIEESSGSGQ